MKFGMPTLVECRDLEHCAQVASRLGLDFIEVNMSFPQYQPHTLSVDEALRISEKYGVSYTIHADELLNPFDFNPVVKKAYVEVMRNTIRFAKALSMPIINMHLLKGVYVTLPGKVILLTDVYKEDYTLAVKEFIAACEEEIGDSGLKIAIENVDNNAFTESQIAALPLFMQSHAFALTLDTGHDICLDGKDRHVFNTYPEKLRHMHLHDCGTDKHPHIALGTGIVDVRASLQKLPKDGTCLVEVKTIEGLEESVRYLKENGLF